VTTGSSPVRRVRAASDVVDLVGGAGPAAAGGPTPSHVWYVSYGSNLLRARLERYLLGGRLAGLDVDYPGGPATAPASDERAVVLPGRLRFALDAPPWGGGGVCFWDPAGAGEGVLARAWRMTLRQYLEVVHLENGGTGRVAVPWRPEVLRDGEVLVDDGWYGRLVLAGRVAGEPALTFTSPRPGVLATRAPSPRYRQVVEAGLVETFGAAARGGLTPDEAVGYVTAAVGATAAGTAPPSGART
jgi:hypothetical protein